MPNVLFPDFNANSPLPGGLADLPDSPALLVLEDGAFHADDLYGFDDDSQAVFDELLKKIIGK